MITRVWGVITVDSLSVTVGLFDIVQPQMTPGLYQSLRFSFVPTRSGCLIACEMEH